MLPPGSSRIPSPPNRGLEWVIFYRKPLDCSIEFSPSPHCRRIGLRAQTAAQLCRLDPDAEITSAGHGKVLSYLGVVCPILPAGTSRNGKSLPSRRRRWSGTASFAKMGKGSKSRIEARLYELKAAETLKFFRPHGSTLFPFPAPVVIWV